VRLKNLPTIGSIQRTTILVAVLATAVLITEASTAAALACIMGAALMMVNLTVLSWTVRAMFGLASQAGGATGLGLMAVPLKMMLLAGIAYFVIAWGHVNLPGFIVGTLTQFAAIFVEVARLSIWDKLAAQCH
jgi:hypothetical protein